MTDRKVKKPINRSEVVKYLNRSFSVAVSAAMNESRIETRATRKVEKGSAVKTRLYEFQCDFSYLINDIEKSPEYIVPKTIQKANDLISEIKALPKLVA